MGDLSSLTIKELRTLIQKAGLSSTDCFEKPDLLRRAEEAKSRLASVPKHHSGRPDTMMLGGYECKVIHNSAKPVNAVVVILHGFGATNSDLVSLAQPISSHLVDKNIAFVFPQAPNSPMSMGMPAWWHLDPMKWLGAAQMGGPAIAQLIREKPQGLDECRNQMAELVRLSKQLVGSNEVPVILGGFSQGAMTAMDLALHLPEEERVHGVIMLSGAPIVVEEWSSKLRNKKGVSVLLTHGTADPVLPFQCSAWTNELLKNGGATVQYETHAGGHDLGGPRIMNSVTLFVETLLKDC